MRNIRFFLYSGPHSAIKVSSHMLFIDCSKGKEFFRFIDKYWGHLNRKDAFQRICTLMRLMQAKTIVVEEDFSNAPDEFDRVQQETAAVTTRLGTKCSQIRTMKCTFLRDSFVDESEFKAYLAAMPPRQIGHILGYAILLNATVARGVWTYVFESIVHEFGSVEEGVWRAVSNLYLHVKRRYKCSVGGIPYDLQGTYYRQQNGITNVCAHACATMMLNNCGEGALVTAEDINKILGFDHIRRKLMVHKSCASEDEQEDLPVGLCMHELKKVFNHYGFDAFPIEFGDDEQQRRFRAFLYGFVESRFPAMLVFNSRAATNDQIGHVVPVVGHTLNPHSWLPSTGSYAIGSWSNLHLSSLGWIDDLIIHDDNFGMQFTLPAHAFKPAHHPDRGENFIPTEALGIFPAAWKVAMLGNDAESIAASIIRQLISGTAGEVFQGNFYTKRLLSEDKEAQGKFTLKKNSVLRTSLVNWSDYIRTLPCDKMMATETVAFIEWVEKLEISHVWLIEVTEPDLFVGNQAKVVDVVLNPKIRLERSTAGDFQIIPGTVLMVRTPQAVLVPRDNLMDWDELPDWKTEGHLPLFQHLND